MCRPRPRGSIPSLIRSFHEPAWQGISNADLHWRTTQLELAALDAPGEQSNEALQAITIGKGKVVLCQAAPWMFDYEQHPYLRTTYRRNVFLVVAAVGQSRERPSVRRFWRCSATASQSLQNGCIVTTCRNRRLWTTPTVTIVGRGVVPSHTAPLR